MKTKCLLFFISLFLLNDYSFGQEVLPVYSDYLTDNIYLAHPAGAGISSYGKARLTGRKQWSSYDNPPELQTLSIHSRLGKSTAVGIVAFNDENGHFSQKGGQLTYAYHIGLNNFDTFQFSFGISASAVWNTIDISSYDRDSAARLSNTNSGLSNKNYYNVDAGFAYRNEAFFSFYTIKNLLLAKRDLPVDQFESNNLRHHLVTFGYQFNQKHITKVKIQPSVMGQYIEHAKELFVDANLKVYVPFNNGEIWGGVSYRKGFNKTSLEAPKYITPFLGIKFKKFVVSYSYATQKNDIVFTGGGFHQITLGYNFYISKYLRKPTWDL